MIFETHTHLDDGMFDSDREEIIAKMAEEHIDRVINVAASVRSVESTMQLALANPSIYAALGVHPNETGELTETNIERIRALTKNPKVVAIGEIGLDYYWDTPGRDIQKKWFQRQLDLAVEVELPVIIHSRDAARDTADILSKYAHRLNGGIIHCYSYSREMSDEFLQMGFSFGIGGVVTFKNAKTLKEVAAYLPMNRIVIETDSPYLSPVPYRSKRNSSLNLSLIIEEIAKIRNLTPAEVEQATCENAFRIFKDRICNCM